MSREVDPKTSEARNTLVLIETYVDFLREKFRKVFAEVRNRYQSKATFDRHFAAPEYAEFQATLKEECIIDFKNPEEAEIRVVKPVAGFM